MRSFRFLPVFLSLIAMLAIAGPALPQSVQEGAKGSTSAVLSVNVNKSTSIAFPTPASTVFIANPEIADVQVVTPTRVMVFGRRTGETNLIISDERGRTIVSRAIIVSQSFDELSRALSVISPTDKIEAKPVPNGVVLSGEVSEPSLIEAARRIAARYVPESDGDIINQIKLRGNNQIQIQVRFAEVSRDADKRLGINWENALTSGNFVFGFATGADFYSGAGAELVRTSMGDSTNDALNIGYTDNHASVQTMLDALAKNGLVTILAEPTLTAMSGETASFLAGGEFPVPVPQGGQSNAITIEWKEYGVSLAFTPTLLDKGRINMHVRPEVSQLSDVGAISINDTTVPSLVTRRAETTVELASGQSFAIAGLLNNNQTQSIQKFPFLGDVPIIGPLFRSTRFQNNESELVIIITPYIVKPTTQEKLALPTDGYSHPTDLEQVLQMRETSARKGAKVLSGPSRAVKVAVPQAEEAPVPKALPVLPVLSEPETEPKVVKQKAEEPPPALPASSLPLSLPVPDKKSENLRPSGPGGFIME